MRPTDLTSTKELSKIPISLHLLLFVVLAFFFLSGPKKKKPNKHRKEKHTTWVSFSFLQIRTSKWKNTTLCEQLIFSSFVQDWVIPEMRHRESLCSLWIVKCRNVQVPVHENYELCHCFEMGVFCGCDFIYYEISRIVIRTGFFFFLFKERLLEVLLVIFWVGTVRIIFIIESWCIGSLSPAQHMKHIMDSVPLL